MKLIHNSGSDRVIDLMHSYLKPAKTNMAAILTQNGIANVQSL